mmetsp:Transcript_18900/g.36716  ORF Transcript_18900/g.36716 Transcript_18900/m.36716 type:complete len:270 (+) Transcript_18900:60-869(+)
MFVRQQHGKRAASPPTTWLFESEPRVRSCHTKHGRAAGSRGCRDGAGSQREDTAGYVGDVGVIAGKVPLVHAAGLVREGALTDHAVAPRANKLGAALLVKVRTLPMLLALLPGARVNVAVGVVEGALALALAVAPRAVILAPVLVGHHAEAVLLALFPPALVLSPWGRCLITIIIFGLLAMIEVRTLSFTHAGKIPAGVRIAVWEGGLGLVAAGGGARAEESHLDALVADAHRLGDAGVARAGALAPVSVRVNVGRQRLLLLLLGHFRK